MAKKKIDGNGKIVMAFDGYEPLKEQKGPSMCLSATNGEHWLTMRLQDKKLYTSSSGKMPIKLAMAYTQAKALATDEKWPLVEKELEQAGFAVSYVALEQQQLVTEA
jgi:hypothetical protein